MSRFHCSFCCELGLMAAARWFGDLRVVVVVVMLVDRAERRHSGGSGNMNGVSFAFCGFYFALFTI